MADIGTKVEGKEPGIGTKNEESSENAESISQVSSPSGESKEEKNEEPIGTEENDDDDVIHQGLMQHKNSKLFSKWKKVYVMLTKTHLILKLKRKDTQILAQYILSDMAFQEICGAGKECSMKVFVKSQKKNFLLAAYSFMQINAWTRALKGQGVEEKDLLHAAKGFSSKLWMGESTAASTARSRLEVVDVNNWKTSDVQEWLGYIRTNDGTKMAEQYGILFAENDIDGRTLLEMTDTSLKAIGIKSLGRRVKILSEIEKLKTKNRYSLNEHLVMSKFERMDPKFMKDLNNLEQRVQALCDVDQIKRTYLSPEQIDTQELKRLIEEEKEEDQDSFSIVEEEEAQQHDETKIRVKLIVTEITHSDSHKSLRKILSPIAATIPMVPKSRFGLFHTALIVGPWYLEWNDSSLCIPKKICSSMAIVSADIDNIIVPKSSDKDELVEKLAEVIVDWNVNMDYINFKPLNKKPTEGNCQDFVEAVLEKLDLKPIFAGALGNFFKDMKKKGTCEMIFRPEQEFIEKFNLSEKDVTFHTHSELDEFVVGLRKINSTFQLDFPSEWTLLKSFDRAFWLRHIKKEEDEAWQPIFSTHNVDHGNGVFEQKNICKCPFEDPRITKSFR